jgi:hypothetical protein
LQAIKFIALVPDVYNVAIWTLGFKCVGERQERGYVAA